MSRSAGDGFRGLMKFQVYLTHGERLLVQANWQHDRER